MKKLFLILLMSTLIGCTSVNPYTETYISTPNVNISINDTKPETNSNIKIINSTNIKDDLINIYEDGYEMVGYSSFNTTDLSEKYVKDQALNVGATLVIYSKTFASQDSELEPMFLNGFCYGGYYSSVNCTGFDWQYVVRSKYDYLATFWVKTNLTELGILVQDISVENRKELGINNGVEVNAIRKDSVARNEIALSDVIIKINGNDIKNKIDYRKIMTENKGKKINLEILRKNKIITKDLMVQ